MIKRMRGVEGGGEEGEGGRTMRDSVHTNGSPKHGIATKKKSIFAHLFFGTFLRTQRLNREDVR